MAVEELSIDESCSCTLGIVSIRREQVFIKNPAFRSITIAVSTTKTPRLLELHLKPDQTKISKMRFSAFYLIALIPAVLSAVTSLEKRFSASCDESNIGDTISDETWTTLLRVWHESFGSDGGSLIEGTASGHRRCKAVCCSDRCLLAQNTASGSRSWSESQFQTAANGLADERAHTQCLFSPLGDQTYYGYVSLEFLNNEYQTNIGDGSYKHMVELFGDTCGGAAPYDGNC